MSSRIPCQAATILVVDDQPVNLGPVVTTLEECGFEIMVAHTGEKGIEIAEQAHPDLILLDALMPGIDGFETCRRLKSRSTTQNIPVIFMTALANTEDKIKGFTAGAVDYVTKPIQNDELLARVTAHLHIRDLQIRLEQQNRELKTTLENLQRTQTQLIESEKLAALGKLVANIAHEINTPISAVSSSIGNMAAILDHLSEHLTPLLLPLSDVQRQEFLNLLQHALAKPTALSLQEEGRQARELSHLLKAQGVACSPQTAEMLVNIGLFEQTPALLAFLREPHHQAILKTIYQLVGLKEGAQTIITATKRVAKIVFALKTYAYPGLPLGEMADADLVQGLEATITLYQNQLRQGVTVVREYAPLPPLRCYPDELQQIWINLIHNALQAMNYAGTLTIACVTRDDQIVVAIRDTGCGIPDEVQPNIFEPFFTTKTEGEGCGLGLSIAQKIVEKHHGAITVESRPGATTFRVSLPIQPSA